VLSLSSWDSCLLPAEIQVKEIYPKKVPFSCYFNYSLIIVVIENLYPPCYYIFGYIGIPGGSEHVPN